MYRRSYYTHFFPVLLVFFLCFNPFSRADAEERFSGWKKTKTEHFTFIYEERDRETVEELLFFCEDVYTSVTDFFDSYPDNVPCVIWGRKDTANGSYSAFPHRINLYVTGPSGPWMGSKTENWLKVLLTHELTHYVHLAYNKGFFHVLGKIFGEDLEVTQGGFQPGWMIEGIAVALETEYTRGGRGRNPFFELYWKAPVIENRLFTLRQASYSSSFPPPGRIYVSGYILVSYMMDTYGKDIFSRIHREFVKFPFIGPRHAIKKVTGDSARDIYADMKTELETKYTPYRELSSGEKLTPDEIGDYYMPVFSKGGLYMYRRTLEKPPAIVAFNPVTKKESIVLKTSLTDSASLTATADGNILYFTSTTVNAAGPAGETYTSDLYRWSKERKRVMQITRNAHVWHPAVSTDGSVLIAVQKQDSYSRLVTIDRTTGTIAPLFEAAGASVYTPDISPDGSTIVFTLAYDGKQDVWILDRKTRQATPINPPDVHGEYNPRFIDNHTILFASDREGDLRLYQFDMDQHRVQEYYRDRIGAYAGEMWEGSLYYGSYTSDGWCVKTAPKPISICSIAWPEREADDTLQILPPSEKPIQNEKHYIDFPKPLAWAPIPAYLDPLGGHLPTAFGLGIFSYGSSYLQRATWYGYLTVPFTVFQPSILFEGSFQVWRFRTGYSYRQVYWNQNYDYYQQLSQSAHLTFPILAKHSLGKTYSLSLTTGLNHSFILHGNMPFHFFNWFDFTGMDKRHRLYWFNSGGFSIKKSTSPRDMFSPFRFLSTIQISLPLPITSDSPEGYVIFNTIELQVPSFFKHQFFRFGVKSNYTTPSLLSSRNSVPRGAFDAEEQPYSGSTVFALDYLFSLGVFDQPLPLGDNMFGFNIQGAALGLHGEIITDWEAGVFTLDEYIYTGIEFILDVGSSLASIPVGLGLSFRFDRTFTEPVTFLDDFRPYFFIELDSFLSASRIKVREIDG